MSCDCNTLVVGEAGAQGPQGLAGINGTNGTNGINAFTTVAAQFTQPAVNDPITFTVAENSWIAVGQTIYISQAGFYTVVSIGGTDEVNATLVRTDGVDEGDPVSSGLKVSPSASATYSDPLSELNVNGNSSLNGQVIVNDSNANVNFTVRGTTEDNLLVTKASNNRVGIKIENPDATLDIVGTLKASDSVDFVKDVTVNSSNGSNNFTVKTAGPNTTLFVKGSTSQVGIGTNNPDPTTFKILDVVGDAQITTLLVNPGGVNGSEVFKVKGASSAVPLIVNATTNRVGIKTVSPTVELDVTGATKISGDVTVGSNVLKVNSTGTFVGINKATPTVALDVVGAATITGVTTIGGNLAVDTDVLKVDVTGNFVGINKASPTVALDVSGDLAVSEDLQITGNSSLTTLQVSGDVAVATNVLKVDASGGFVGINKTTPTVALDVSGAAKVSTDLTVSDALYVINSSGFVGINQASPSFELEVNGSVKAVDYRIDVTPSDDNATLTKFLYGSGDGTFAVAANSTDASIVITVTGAVVGDFVQVSYSPVPSITPELLTLFGYVSAADTVTVVISNGTATGVANQTYSVNVLVTGAVAS